MKVVGIGGAGGKIATKIDTNSLIINVSESELEKVNSKNKVLACAHDSHLSQGQLKGSKKNPEIGKNAFLSISETLFNHASGGLVISSTGGGTGNGICSELLERISSYDTVPDVKKISLALILPHAEKEANEYVENTISLLSISLSKAVDSANTGNIFLFSNKQKFESRISEEQYNQSIVAALKTFNSIPKKGDNYELLEGHIDAEDFIAYSAKSFFNHFTSFHYDASKDFEQQLKKNFNPLLLVPDTPIEALFLLEVPNKGDETICYNILDYFSSIKIAPIFSVVHNPNLTKPSVTVSLLYSRKPTDLVSDFHRISQATTKTKINRSINQQVAFDDVAINLKKVVDPSQQEGQNITLILKRLGKL